jgi:hypothetical protein
MATAVANEREHIQALSQLTLNPSASAEAIRHIAALAPAERDELVSLADSNHVIIRALQPIVNGAVSLNFPELAQWAQAAIDKERARIMNALSKLEVVCNELEAAGCQTTVMKSLDHWPDLGNDLDLYSTADERIVCRVMTEKFKAHIEPRSWGDRLANKWNFQVPGLPEAIEVHAKRLGQTGEHTALARRFVTRRVQKTVESMTFYVPAPEERIIVATLQRMYRHFYFRVCDIVNTKNLVESGTLDYVELKKAADIGGIWPGVCSYLRIVSDYVKQYRGTGLDLPADVTAAAPFGGEKVFVKGRFIRVPIMPQGADLYTRQVTSAAFRGDVPATFRLSLLPPLASAAAVAFKITGSDKGIW